MARLLALAPRHLTTPLPLPLACWRSGRSLAAAATSPEAQEQLVCELKRSLAEAIESAEMVGPSATLLLLETDPACRGPRESYELHYAELALIQLEGALAMHEQLQAQVGAGEAEALVKREKLALPLADCQLWRDRTRQVIASVTRRQRDNEVACQD